MALPPIASSKCLCDPETGEPFILLEAERAFSCAHSRSTTMAGCSIPSWCFGAIKKSGKTTLAGIIVLVMILLFGGRFAEGYCVANDLEQAQSRVFTMIKRICEASPLLCVRGHDHAEQDHFPALGATITALASDYAGAAGGNPTITCFDELWAYTSGTLSPTLGRDDYQPCAQDQLAA